MKLFYVVFLVEAIIPSLAFEIQIGDCPVYLNEPCRPGLIKFILFTIIHDQIVIRNLNPFHPRLPNDYDVSRPLKIVIHGYGGLNVDIATSNVTAAYQNTGHNVITVDWAPLAQLPCYPTAYLNTWHVAQCLSILTVSLMALAISPESLHVIGFSLGAHIAGFTGHQLKETTGLSLGRITGLDPALPFFATLDKKWKLDPGDAKFVDVIHTSSGTFGKLEASGHVDYYVNGGAKQPLCEGFKYPPLCSHLMAGLYFAESIEGNTTFVGIECRNGAEYMFGFCNSGRTATMGEFADHTIRGVFFVNTAPEAPFALGDVTLDDLLYRNNVHSK